MFKVSSTDYINYGLLPFGMITIIYWILCTFFMLMDHYCEINGLLEKWKFQGKYLNGSFNWKKYYNTIKMVLFNQLIIDLPISIIITPYNMKLNDNALPYSNLIWQIPLILILEDCLFYIGHRSLHNPFLYKHIHSIHHEWTIPVAMRTIYAHPIEHLMCNIMPLLISGHLCRLDWFCYNILLLTGLINAILVHSDYKLNGYGEQHDNHHKYRTCNYGVLGIMDQLFGTEQYCIKKQYIKLNT